MIEVYVKLLLDGADEVPALTMAKELEAYLAGSSIPMRDEDGVRAWVVIEDAVLPRPGRSCRSRRYA